MRYKSALFILSVVFNTITPQNSISVNGLILNNKFKHVYLEELLTSTIVDTSAIDENGKFSFSTIIDHPDYYRLSFDKTGYVMLILQPGEELVIEIDMNNMEEPKVNGSSNTEKLYSTLFNLKSFEEKIKEYSQKIKEEKEEYLKNFILKNSRSLTTLYFIEQLDMNRHFDLYEQLSNNLLEAHPDNQFVKSFAQRVNKTGSLLIGRSAPEIILPDEKGEINTLSSLKGNIVLIDFWAAWCGPCRKNNPHLVELYNKYNEKGFEIFSVSLDKDRELWIRTIKEDKLNWTNVSDLKFWNSKVVSLYGFQSIPFSVLIDKNGKIIAKGLLGIQLENKLKELLN